MEILDQVFELLEDKRRRYALYHLEREDDPVPLDDLAEQVAAWETDAPRAPAEEKQEDVKLELYHDDLPEASEASYVRYDPEEKVVELTGPPPEFDAILTVAKVIERPDRNL